MTSLRFNGSATPSIGIELELQGEAIRGDSVTEPLFRGLFHNFHLFGLKVTFREILARLALDKHLLNPVQDETRSFFSCVLVPESLVQRGLCR